MLWSRFSTALFLFISILFSTVVQAQGEAPPLDPTRINRKLHPLVEFVLLAQEKLKSGSPLTTADLVQLKSLLPKPASGSEMSDQLKEYYIFRNSVSYYEFSEELWLVITSEGQLTEESPLESRYMAVDLKAIDWSSVNQETNPDHLVNMVFELMKPERNLPEALQGRSPQENASYNLAPHYADRSLGDGFEKFGEVVDDFIDTYVTPRMDDFFADNGIELNGPLFSGANAPVTFGGEQCEKPAQAQLLVGHGQTTTTPYGFGGWFDKLKCAVSVASPAVGAALMMADVALSLLDVANIVEKCTEECFCACAAEVMGKAIDILVDQLLGKWGKCLGAMVSQAIDTLVNLLTTMLQEEMQEMCEDDSDCDEFECDPYNPDPYCEMQGSGGPGGGSGSGGGSGPGGGSPTPQRF